jgi:hypothetical protein
MKHSALYDTPSWLIGILLFILMFSAIRIGFRIGMKKAKPESDDSGILASLLGLLALLLAFTFGMAGARYETRKANLVLESNEIGTAILRSDIYPDSLTKGFRKDFEDYLDARIAFFISGRDDTKIAEAQHKAAKISVSLWKRAAIMAKNKDFFIQSNMMLPALNDMFDSAEATNASFRSSVPDSIVYLLLVFSIVVSFYIGYSCGFKKVLEPTFVIGFCLLTCFVILITIDLDRPRRGTIDMQDEIYLLKTLKGNF